MSAPVFVRGVGVWSEADGSRAQLLPARMRGRASPLTLMLAAVVEQAAREAGAEAACLPSVFGSAYGEMHTTAALLQQLSAADAVLSPAKFQASVHNTGAAQLSIALRNPSFTTSIAAGYDTLAMCLLEAFAWLVGNPGQIVVACADEAPNQVLQPGVSYPQLAAAFVLDNVAQQGLMQLELIAPHAAPSSAAVESGNPVASAVDLARAIRQGATTTLAVGGHGYRVLLEQRGAG